MDARASARLLLAGIALVMLAGCSLGSAGTTVSAASVNAMFAPRTVAANRSVPQSAAPTTVLDVSGSGIKTTQSFTVGPAWDMAWSYDCSAFGQQGNFAALVKLPGGGSSPNIGTNQLGTGGSDVEHFHAGGTFYLEIISDCAWHIVVTG